MAHTQNRPSERWLRLLGLLASALGACADTPLSPIDGDLQEPLAQVAWTRAAITARYPNITVRGLGEEDELWEELFDATPKPPLKAAPAGLIEPSPEQLAYLARALELAPPALRDAVANIGFAHWPASSAESDSLGGATVGTDIVINADRFVAPRPNFERVAESTILHEMAHSFTHLLDYTSERRAGRLNARGAQFLEAYPESLRKRAEELVTRHRLENGLTAHWKAMHESGVPFGKTGPYGSGVSTESAPERGFVSAYGATEAIEDLAEYVATVVVPTEKKPGYCPRFQGAKQLTPASAIPYAKLLLLRDLQMITASQFDGCAAGAAPRHQPGIHFDGVASTNAVRAGTATSNGIPYFRFMASGPGAYEMMIDLRLPRKGHTPVGLHRIETVPLVRPDLFTGSAIYLSHDNIDLVRTGVGGAFVLVSDFSTNHASGVIFDLVLENAFGVDIDELPYGTFSTR